MQATRKDIMGLFTPFGQIKSCRLPRKFDGNHRCVWEATRVSVVAARTACTATLTCSRVTCSHRRCPSCLGARLTRSCSAALPFRSGFAFVDFATKQEARNAMEAVQVRRGGPSCPASPPALQI